MKKYIIFIMVLSLCVCAGGCSKKQEALEDMQQPMSPEDLNRLKTETQAQTSTTTAGQASVAGEVAANSEMQLEPLPPQGPYKPTAKEIQTALLNAGFYKGAVDGKVGPMTKKAIEDFQSANGLKADGVVGPKTWTALSRYLNAVPAGVTE